MPGIVWGGYRPDVKKPLRHLKQHHVPTPHNENNARCESCLPARVQQANAVLQRFACDDCAWDYRREGDTWKFVVDIHPKHTAPVLQALRKLGIDPQSAKVGRAAQIRFYV